jgi:hypothetical protein
MIKISPILALFLILSLFHKTALSDNHIYQFAIFNSNAMKNSECALVERFSNDKEALMRYAGVIDKYACNVYIPKSIYDQKFQLCYQSGINLKSPSEGTSFECFVQKRDDDIWFLAHLSDSQTSDAQIMCYFSCLGK